MDDSRRQFLARSGAAGLASVLAAPASAAQPPLASLTSGAVPIRPEERRARVARAQRLLRDHDLAALVVEAGSTLVYFTGVRWYRSERFTGVVIPRDGEIAVVTPYFEEPSVRESLVVGDDVRAWHEHEDPFALVAGILADRKLTSGRMAMEGTVRHFIADGIGKAAPRFEVVPGEAVVRGCRMYKSPAEIALLQAASDVTMAAYRHVYPRVEVGMRPRDIATMMDQATAALGGSPDYIFGQFGVRLEDCLHITAEGPRLFSALSASLDRPFG